MRPHRAFTAVGLCLAFGAPPLLAFACEHLGAAPVVTILLGQTGMIAIAVAVVGIARRHEGLTWSSLGVRRPTLSTVVGALLLAAGYLWIASPLAMGLLRVAGSAGFSTGLSRLAVFPLWTRAITVVVAGVVEEWLYRGYAISRLASLTGSARLGGAIATLVFAAAHVPLWGVAVSSSLLLAGALGTTVYLWRRDLALNMIAHVITDAVGILLVA